MTSVSVVDRLLGENSAVFCRRILAQDTFVRVEDDEMRCKAVHRKLNAYLDGELSAEAAARVEEHVQACPLCADELAGLNGLGILLDAAPRVEAPERFALSVRRAAARRGGARDSKVIPIRWAALSARVAAMLALVFGIGLGGVKSGSVMGTRRAQVQTPSEQLVAELSLDLLSAVPSDSVTEAYLEWAGDLE